MTTFDELHQYVDGLVLPPGWTLVLRIARHFPFRDEYSLTVVHDGERVAGNRGLYTPGVRAAADRWAAWVAERTAA